MTSSGSDAGDYTRQFDNNNRNDGQQVGTSADPLSTPSPSPLSSSTPESAQRDTSRGSSWAGFAPVKSLFGGQGHHRSQTTTTGTASAIPPPQPQTMTPTKSHRRSTSGTPSRHLRSKSCAQIELPQLRVAAKLAENQLSPNMAANLLSYMDTTNNKTSVTDYCDTIVGDIIGNNSTAKDGNDFRTVEFQTSYDDNSASFMRISTCPTIDSHGGDSLSTSLSIINNNNSNDNNAIKNGKVLRMLAKYTKRKKSLLSKKSKSSSKKDGDPEVEEKLDTYSGVFLPCLAQIVGVIFFLRLPTITGQAGTIGTTLIILVCVFSTFVTSLSLSAIASNGTIQAGGPYYIISRTLGVEIGGALGILFYLGTTLGASMHVMGAVETLFNREKHAYQSNNYGFSWAALLDSCPSQVWSLLLMLIIANIVNVGSKYVTKAANFFLVTVGLSILSILLGTVVFAAGWYDGSLTDDERIFNDNLYPNYRPDSKTGVTPTFWGLVAIFYPATTGIMAGTNRSSKLATPNKSISIGTISAIAVTTLLYITQVWLIGSVVDHETLIFNKLVLTSVAFPSRVIAKVGMVTSCIGAALQCMAGAPQLLSAIAADGAIPFLKFLTRKKRKRIRSRIGSPREIGGLASLGESTSIDNNNDSKDADSVASEKSEDVEYENSKRAVWFSWAIASLGTLLGNIDHITPILTMFYLMMYGGINLCCFLLAWVDSPGFRPQFKYFSRNTAFLGFLWCLILAVLISLPMALLAILLTYLIFKYIDLSAQQAHVIDGSNEKSSSRTGTNWGDVFDSVRYKITTAILSGVTGTENFHAKNWRPQLLTLVDTNDDGTPLSTEVLALASQFRGGRGLNMVVSIKDGSFLHDGIFELSQQCNAALKRCMEKERLQGFSEVVFTKASFEEAVWSAVVHSGLGPVSPNTVLMSWMADWRKRINGDRTKKLSEENNTHPKDKIFSECSVDEYVGTLKGLGHMQRGVCLFKGSKFPRTGDIVPVGSTIDIYWIVDDGGLCLLLSYIISRNPIWRRNVRLQVFAVTTTIGDNPHDLESAVVEFLQQIRINATVIVVNMQDTTVANDFRSFPGDGCPASAPILTIGETFQSKDDLSCSSSVSEVRVFPSLFTPGGLGDTACLPSIVAPESNNSSDVPAKFIATNGQYVAMVEHSESQQFLSLETAQKLNNLIRMNSPSASLVVSHLPLPHKVQDATEFMEYIDAMFKDVDNMLLIQGTGVEYLTTVA